MAASALGNRVDPAPTARHAPPVPSTDVPDTRALPVVARYHPHGSEQARVLAEHGLVLRC